MCHARFLDLISIHSLRMEGDPPVLPVLPTPHISIHSLRMEGDLWRYPVGIPEKHFNPLPPHGGRRIWSRYRFTVALFQSTPSAWRETRPSRWCRKSQNHFNPLPPHGGRHDCCPCFIGSPLFQSTPSAWRETCDRDIVTGFQIVISIHSLRMEGDPFFKARRINFGVFQSTPSAWRETRVRFICQHRKKDFNPLPPHGGRPPWYG